MDVKSAGRTLDLFETFAKAQAPLSLSELARELKAPPSSCFNLVRALEARGYLYAIGSKRLYPTRRLIDVASAIATGEPWRMRLEPVLTRLRDETRETIILGKRQGDHVIYLDVLEGPQTIRYSARAGDLKPLHSSAIGKAMLAAIDPEELPELVKALPLNRVTPATITDRNQLIAEVEDGRGKGYCVTSGENVADVSAVAAAVRLETDTYGIAIAGPILRMTGAMEQHIARLRAACTTAEPASLGLAIPRRIARGGAIAAK